jgi:iron complex outermembrane receptor protein
MKPRVSTGGRPVGTPSLYARADINYRTDILGGLTGILGIVHTGSRLVSPTLEVPGYTTVDLGLRYQFKVGTTAASIRAVAQNIFDAASWKVVAANTLYPEERRRFTISLAADF